MTVLDEMLPIMVDMCEKKDVGTYNFTNPRKINHNEILEMYREMKDKNYTWKNFEYEDQEKILQSGRSNNFLDCSKLEKSYKVKNIKESVREVMQNYE